MTDELRKETERLLSMSADEPAWSPPTVWIDHIRALQSELDRLRQQLAERENVHAVLTDSDHTGAVSVYTGMCSDGVEREFVRRDQLAERGEPPYPADNLTGDPLKDALLHLRFGMAARLDDGVGKQGCMNKAVQCIERAIKASPPAQSAVPEGWKLVPVEPTREMLQRASEIENDCAIHNYGGHPDAEEYWEVMISAAPSAGEAQGGAGTTALKLSGEVPMFGDDADQFAGQPYADQPFAGEAQGDGREAGVSDIERDAKKFLGLPPFDGCNPTAGDDRFYKDRAAHWGDEAWRAAIAAQRGGDGDA